MKSKTFEGRQVKCLIADEGHVWIHYYDELPLPVRQRLANSRFNICPACMVMEALKRVRRGQPTIAMYCEVIDEIERQLDGVGDK
jgi:hypothetical protein